MKYKNLPSEAKPYSKFIKQVDRVVTYNWIFKFNTKKMATEFEKTVGGVFIAPTLVVLSETIEEKNLYDDYMRI